MQYHSWEHGDWRINYTIGQSATFVKQDRSAHHQVTVKQDANGWTASTGDKSATGASDLEAIYALLAKL